VTQHHFISIAQYHPNVLLHCRVWDRQSARDLDTVCQVRSVVVVVFLAGLRGLCTGRRHIHETHGRGVAVHVHCGDQAGLLSWCPARRMGAQICPCVFCQGPGEVGLTGDLAPCQEPRHYVLLHVIDVLSDGRLLRLRLKTAASWLNADDATNG